MPHWVRFGTLLAEAGRVPAPVRARTRELQRSIHVISVKGPVCHVVSRGKGFQENNLSGVGMNKGANYAKVLDGGSLNCAQGGAHLQMKQNSMEANVFWHSRDPKLRSGRPAAAGRPDLIGPPSFSLRPGPDSF